MDYGQLPIFSLMRQEMRYLGQRQAVLAQNVANADTPGYVAQDVKKPDFGAALSSSMGRLQMTRTHSGHLSAGGMNAPSYDVIPRDHVSELNPNGNKVSIEEEVQKVAMNQMEYNQATALYRKSVDLFRTAIGRNGGA